MMRAYRLYTRPDQSSHAFSNVGSEKFRIRPGNDSGHKWRLVNGEPWKRAYVASKNGSSL
jgi:hypothetical protein